MLVLKPLELACLRPCLAAFGDQFAARCFRIELGSLGTRQCRCQLLQSVAAASGNGCNTSTGRVLPYPAPRLKQNRWLPSCSCTRYGAWGASCCWRLFSNRLTLGERAIPASCSLQMLTVDLPTERLRYNVGCLLFRPGARPSRTGMNILVCARSGARSVESTTSAGAAQLAETAQIATSTTGQARR